MNYRVSKGFSLIEVLIAFVILVIGLLGATTLVIRSSQANMTAYETEQVALVVSSFVEKIRLNNSDSAIAEYGKNSGSEVKSCINDGCSAGDRAKMDMYVFQEQLDQLSLANNTPTWTFTTAETTIENTPYYICNLLVRWGDGDAKNSYSANFMMKKVTP